MQTFRGRIPPAYSAITRCSAFVVLDSSSGFCMVPGWDSVRFILLGGVGTRFRRTTPLARFGFFFLTENYPRPNGPGCVEKPPLAVQLANSTRKPRSDAAPATSHPPTTEDARLPLAPLDVDRRVESVLPLVAFTHVAGGGVRRTACLRGARW